MGCGDVRGAVVGAGEKSRIVTEIDRERHELGTVATVAMVTTW